jgi:glycosyltransferase involved in cell wall biosynthesis
MKLSIIIPVVNEENSLEKVVVQVYAFDTGEIEKEFFIFKELIQFLSPKTERGHILSI